MNDSSLHPLARDYLKRLKKAAANLPRARRNELLGEIEAHLSEALPAVASEVEALNVLERLGEPAEIVAEIEPGPDTLHGKRASALEWIAVILLLIGGIVFPIVGWIVGVVLLWISKIWTTRDKLVGTFVLPGGLGLLVWGVALVVNVSSLDQQPFTVATCLFSAVLIAGLVLPILTSIYLARRARRPEVTT
jgi:hypothetical protein